MIKKFNKSIINNLTKMCLSNEKFESSLRFLYDAALHVGIEKLIYGEKNPKIVVIMFLYM